jgi:hypothetical protein
VISLAGDNESGITVTGSSKDEVIKKLIPYLEDVLADAEKEVSNA